MKIKKQKKKKLKININYYLMKLILENHQQITQKKLIKFYQIISKIHLMIVLEKYFIQQKIILKMKELMMQLFGLMKFLL